MSVPVRGLALALAPLVALSGGGCRPKARGDNRVIVFAAASLDQVLSELAAHLRAHGGLDTQVEISGSQEAARKVSEYGRRADLVLVADIRVIDWILKPAYASQSLRVATNEVVIAYSDRSRYATEINKSNWAEVLARPDVRVARADENQAPIGYQTLLCWQLAGIAYAKQLQGRDLSALLVARTGKDLVRPDVTSLVPLIGTRADYVFVYRSVAHNHNLPYVRLSSEVNLGDPGQAAFYARAQVPLKTPKTTIHGAPIVYGAAVPLNAPHPRAGNRFLSELLGPKGQEILARNGFTPTLYPPTNY
jgi:molybdate/tungstate transport system substrate-binding protein